MATYSIAVGGNGTIYGVRDYSSDLFGSISPNEWDGNPAIQIGVWVNNGNKKVNVEASDESKWNNADTLYLEYEGGTVELDWISSSPDRYQVTDADFTNWVVAASGNDISISLSDSVGTSASYSEALNGTQITSNAGSITLKHTIKSIVSGLSLVSSVGAISENVSNGPVEYSSILNGLVVTTKGGIIYEREPAVKEVYHFAVPTTLRFY